MSCIIDASNVCLVCPEPTVYEDPRLREIEYGYNKEREQIENERSKREKFGYFLYRFEGGESPADCYDRMCTFIESLMRQVKRKNRSRVLIVAHGIIIKCFVMRWLHLSVEEFDSLKTPKNCDVVTITHHEQLLAPQFKSGKWGVEGLTFY